MADDSCNNNMAYEHTKSTRHEEFPSSPSINEEHSWESEDKVNDSKDSSSQKRSGSSIQSKPGEDGWCVVNNGVNAAELLEEHENATQGKTAEEASVGE